jgi:hypothetical protein
MASKKYLIIPDPHSHPEYDNDRFEALGNLIIEEQPDVILCIGDIADMPSLSSYDKGKRGFEGRRYLKDISSVIDAQNRLFQPLNQYNKGRRRKYKPKTVITVGNHEHRIERATEAQPELHGTIGLKDLQLRDYWQTIVPFKECIVLDGIAFSHYFSSGLKGFPISGEHIGATMCTKLFMSAVQGHSHLFNITERTRPDGNKLFGLSVGCYSHPDMIEGWNRGQHHMWWHGVIIMEGVGVYPGYYEEIRPLIQSKIMREYL